MIAPISPGPEKGASATLLRPPANPGELEFARKLFANYCFSTRKEE
jgi:hypothetical protein